MDITLQLLNANDINSVFAGLQCLLAICRVYRYKAGDKREDLDTVTKATFPLILSIGDRLVQDSSTEAGEMLKLILKIYKHAVYVCINDSTASLLTLTRLYSSKLLLTCGRTPP